MLKLSTRFLLTILFKRDFEIVLFCLDLELFVITNYNNIRSKENKKLLKSLLQTLLSNEGVKISAENIKLYGSWSTSKFLILQTNNQLSRKYRALSKFKEWILHYFSSAHSMCHFVPHPPVVFWLQPPISWSIFNLRESCLNIFEFKFSVSLLHFTHWVFILFL